jgi:hypothetical protein
MENEMASPGNKVRSIAELAKEALAVQDACNLSGVVHGFSRALTELRHHIPSNNEIHRHPITLLWVDKIASLTGTQCDGVPSAAYLLCSHLADVSTPRLPMIPLGALAVELPMGTLVKISYGAMHGDAIARVVSREFTEWGPNTFVEIVESSSEGVRAGARYAIHGEETLLGIGWKVLR